MAESGTKEVLWNGSVVGRIPATGDDEKDFEASVTLLRGLGLYVDSSTEQRMFSRGASFAAAAELMLRNLQIDKPGANKF